MLLHSALVNLFSAVLQLVRQREKHGGEQEEDKARYSWLLNCGKVYCSSQGGGFFLLLVVNVIKEVSNTENYLYKEDLGRKTIEISEINHKMVMLGGSRRSMFLTLNHIS